MIGAGLLTALAIAAAHTASPLWRTTALVILAALTFAMMLAACRAAAADRALLARLAHRAAEADDYRRLADHAQGLEVLLDREGCPRWMNLASAQLTGYRTTEDTAPSFIDMCIHADDRRRSRDLATRIARGESCEHQELRILREDGTAIWHACRWYALRNAAGMIVGVRLSGQDIQRRKDVEDKLVSTVSALRHAQALTDHYLSDSNDERMRLASLLDTVSLGIVFVDRDHRVVYINRPALDIWSLADRQDLVGVLDEDLIEATRALRCDDNGYRKHVAEVLSQRSASAYYDIAMNDGRTIREVSSVVPSHTGQWTIGRVWVYEDITEVKHVERKLTELAERDSLTHLLNRRRFLEELERQLADGARRRLQVGLIIFDLDGFKQINDTYGHQAGDEVLVALAAAVGGIVRRNELFFRLGGDEFALLVSDTDQDRMQQLARRVLDNVAALTPVFDGRPCALSASLGIAVAPHHAHDPIELVVAADRAMYVAKSRGKNRSEVASERDEGRPFDHAAVRD
ncbi:MAG: diguanylate cyclase [Rhodocyclaceae bacterium]